MQRADSGGEVSAWLNTVWPKCISAQLLQEAFCNALGLSDLWLMKLCLSTVSCSQVSGNFPPGD